jgi:hypothetical protein
MEQLLTSYGISFPEFKEAMTRTNSIIAGSSALYAYLTEKGINPGYEPNDIDIWVEDRVYTILNQGGYNYRSNVSLILQTVLNCGFSVHKMRNLNWISADHDPNDVYIPELAGIKKIYYLKNKDGKEIQIIETERGNLAEYIAKRFDFSICATWWNAVENKLHTLHPAFTEKKRMFLLRPAEVMNKDKYEKRYVKYEGRGFTLTEQYPPHLYSPDDREQLCKMDKTVTAFDMWEYDDVNCIEFLEQSPWNILLKIGDNFQAFNRRNLLDFMNKRSIYITYIGKVFDTPTHQTITENAFTIIGYSDYSIFEFSKEYNTDDVDIHEHKTLYTVNCYTLKGWIDSVISHIISPMPIPDIRTMQRIEDSARQSEILIRMIMEGALD